MHIMPILSIMFFTLTLKLLPLFLPQRAQSPKNSSRFSSKAGYARCLISRWQLGLKRLMKKYYDRAHYSTRETRRGGKDNNDRSGPYGGGSIDFKTGPNGTEWSVSGHAGYEDERGNYVEGHVSRNDKGETSGGARAGYENDK